MYLLVLYYCVELCDVSDMVSLLGNFHVLCPFSNIITRCFISQSL